MKPTLTIFTSPKPFTNPHIAVIQRNAIRSWLALGDEVQVILLGAEAGVEEITRELNVSFIPKVARNSSGTPLISALFGLAREENNSPLLAYVNADVLLLPDFLESAKAIQGQAKEFLVVGQRWDLQVDALMDFSVGWQQRLQDECRQNGKLHKATGSDYFIFPRDCFTSIPDFAIGRAGWDNWMLYEARQRGWKLIDATAVIRVIHQNHDYSHLPGGKPHYHLPETDENVRLAGGKRHIFMLADANWQFGQKGLSHRQMTWLRFWREVEIFPIVHLHSGWMGALFFWIFHPQKAYNEFRKNQSKQVTQE